MEAENFSNEAIELENLPGIENIEYENISKDYLWVLYLRSILTYAIVFFIYFMVAFNLRESLSLETRKLLPVLLALWVMFGFYRLYKIYKKKGYALREHDVNYKSGWLWKKATTIPYYRIQHCDLSSGPVERMFDLSTLNIYTAGGSNSDLSIPGLNTDHGLRLKKFILSKMGQDEEE